MKHLLLVVAVAGAALAGVAPAQAVPRCSGPACPDTCLRTCVLDRLPCIPEIQPYFSRTCF
jgi:hypothetical protein